MTSGRFNPILFFKFTIGKFSWIVKGTKGSPDVKKNDRMSSGGTLRQKFNLIDILHLTFDI